ncbi:MAG: septum formation initiator family protein [Firmicutes bacterium]|nr:septum formation initiator family protein [Bacillota bacterium]
MNAAWLLRSRTLWAALGVSSLLSTAILFLSPDGLPALRKRRAELVSQKEELLKKARQNRELAEQVRLLSAKDPELFEALARRQGYARPGETVYSFRERR